ncbi:Chitin-binding protein CbpD [Porphyridium purpureum]|uniref:Chitin-binding protein CbpD n=1 Tax=Porphyridium purpureum TaxID=35688 RepID=A0A5J4Z4I5_PORPP|nr:Chitin-binding protein CbpD [Porphyridium purpureum]|eukprot:POR9249..scf295_1
MRGTGPRQGAHARANIRKHIKERLGLSPRKFVSFLEEDCNSKKRKRQKDSITGKTRQGKPAFVVAMQKVVAVAIAVAVVTGVAHAHGTLAFPPSRAYYCWQNPAAGDCGKVSEAVKSNWMEVGQYCGAGQECAPPAATQLCSGNKEIYSDVERVDLHWYRTEINRTGEVRFNFLTTADHLGTVSIYMTTDDAPLDVPLAPQHLEFMCSYSWDAGTNDGSKLKTFSCPVPARVRDEHVIHAVWEAQITANELFMSCADVRLVDHALAPSATPDKYGMEHTHGDTQTGSCNAQQLAACPRGCLWIEANACYAEWDRATCERYTEHGYVFCGVSASDHGDAVPVEPTSTPTTPVPSPSETETGSIPSLECGTCRGCLWLAAGPVGCYAWQQATCEFHAEHGYIWCGGQVDQPGGQKSEEPSPTAAPISSSSPSPSPSPAPSADPLSNSVCGKCVGCLWLEAGQIGCYPWPKTTCEQYAGHGYLWCDGQREEGGGPSQSPSSPLTPTPQPAPTTTPTPSLPPSNAPEPEPTGGDLPEKGAEMSCSEVLEKLKNLDTSRILVSQQPDLSYAPSEVYVWQDGYKAMLDMYEQGVGPLRLWLGDSSAQCTYGLVNIAAFLSQAMKETIMYDACDENNWDASSGYAASNACGQLGQSYQDYTCAPSEEHMQCQNDPTLRIVATTHAKWYGAPGPLFCGPKEEIPQSPKWNYGSPWCSRTVDYGKPVETYSELWEYLFDSQDICRDYAGQQAGGWEFCPGGCPNAPATAFGRAARTDVEGCAWWGRGIIQTTGICNFGKLNYYLGARAAREGRDSLYPDIDFCKDPEAVCNSARHPELKWVAGLFYWLESVQSYRSTLGDGWTYMDALRQFVDAGMPSPGADTGFIRSVSGIVNRGCHNPPCAAGAVDGGADRAHNFETVLSAMGLI